MKFKGNPSKMQFFVFVIINDFELSSFKFLEHFCTSTQKFETSLTLIGF